MDRLARRRESGALGPILTLVVRTIVVGCSKSNTNVRVKTRAKLHGKGRNGGFPKLRTAGGDCLPGSVKEKDGGGVQADLGQTNEADEWAEREAFFY